MIPKINSAHGADTRNIINRAIEVLNVQGKTIQDLVAEGQLTPTQYAQLITVVNGNIRRGDVSVYDIDKNKGKLDQTYMSEEFLQQMSGNTPINAVPADLSLTTRQFANKSITRDKLNDGYSDNGTLDGVNIDTVYKTGIYLVIPPIVGTLPDEWFADGFNETNDTAFLEVSIASNRHVLHTITSLNRHELHSRRRVDTSVGIPKEWKKTKQEIPDKSITNAKIGDGVMARSKMMHTFMSDPTFQLNETNDLNDIKVEGNYYGINSINRPTEFATGWPFYLMQRNFYLANGNVGWAIQTVYDLTAPEKMYVRKIIVTGGGSNTTWKRVGNVESNNNNVINRFAGKSIVCFGDSITGSFIPPLDYPTKLKEYLGVVPHNVGFGGARMAEHSIAGYDPFSMYRLIDEVIKPDSDPTKWALQDANYTIHNTFWRQLSNLKAVDFNNIEYVTIWYGTNDYGAGVIQDNELDKYDTTTYAGATRYSLEKLMTAYPHLRVMLISPMFRERGESNSDDTPNDGGYFVEDYMETLQKVGKEYKVPVLNMLEESSVNKYNYHHYLHDGLHPSENGVRHIGGKIAGKLSSVY